MPTTKCQGDRRTRTLIRTLLSRQLEPFEVDFLLKLWEVEIIHAGRIGMAESLLRRGWLERDGRTVRLSPSTKQLLAEAA